MPKSPDILTQAEGIASKAWIDWDRKESVRILTTLYPQRLVARLRDQVSEWADILREDWQVNTTTNEKFINTLVGSILVGTETGQKLGDWRIGAVAGAFVAFYTVGVFLAHSVYLQAENQETSQDD